MNSPPPAPRKKPMDEFYGPSVYDKRTRHYREPYVFPENNTKWWLKNKNNFIVQAVIHHALNMKEPFFAGDVHEQAKFINGNLVKSAGALSPSKDKVTAMIRHCGYFKGERKLCAYPDARYPAIHVTLWRKI